MIGFGRYALVVLNRRTIKRYKVVNGFDPPGFVLSATMPEYCRSRDQVSRIVSNMTSQCNDKSDWTSVVLDFSKTKKVDPGFADQLMYELDPRIVSDTCQLYLLGCSAAMIEILSEAYRDIISDKDCDS